LGSIAPATYPRSSPAFLSPFFLFLFLFLSGFIGVHQRLAFFSLLSFSFFPGLSVFISGLPSSFSPFFLFLSEFIRVHQRLAFFSLLLSEFIRVYQWLAFFSLFFSESIQVHQWLNVFLCSSMAAKENTGLKSQPRVVIKKNQCRPFIKYASNPTGPVNKVSSSQPARLELHCPSRLTKVRAAV